MCLALVVVATCDSGGGGVSGGQGASITGSDAAIMVLLSLVVYEGGNA